MKTASFAGVCCIAILLATSAVLADEGRDAQPGSAIRIGGRKDQGQPHDQQASASSKPNILFILADDLGWRDLGCYGHGIHETPHIDKLAGDGMRFTDAYAACPVCGPTRASIMSGKFPSRSGYTHNWLPPDNEEFWGEGMPRDRHAFMKLEEFTLAEALNAGGYQTGFVGKWHLGEEPYYPRHQGFDINVAGCSMGAPGPGGYFSPYNISEVLPAFKSGPKGEYLTDRVTAEAIRIMDKFSKKEKPWLMYMSYYTVHAPIQAKAEKVKKYAAKVRQAKGRRLHSATYAGMVESLDENVGRLIQWLDDRKLRENTIIVFTSDNGGHRGATHNRPLRGYKGDLYEGGIRVPWIVQWPGVTKPGSVCSQPVISTDFYPTILEMSGQPPRPEQHVDGVSLVPMLKGDSDLDRGPMVWHYPHDRISKPASAIRVGDWKFIKYYEDGRQELYNLKRDIGESQNLVKRMPEKAVELKTRLDAMLKEHGAKIPRRDPRFVTQGKPHGQQANPSSKPNIVFILADDLGYGDVGCYGAEKIQTPNIDRLAKEGVLFTDAHTECSTCSPTRYGLLTGRYCFRTWLKYSALSTSAPLLIEEDRVTVASLLKSAGYSTSIVGKWHLGFGREEGFADGRTGPPNHWETRKSGPNWNGELKPGPLEVGFDTSYVIPVANSFPPYVIVENHHVEGLRKDSPIGRLVSKNGGLMEGGEGARWKDEELVDKLTGKVISQLEGFAKKEKPFFLYYAPHQPHKPHRPNARFKGTSQFEAYGDVVQELDWSVGEVLKTLDRLGLSENTLVIFSSDNGPAGGGRPRGGHWPVGRIMRGGKGDILEGGHRVPFIARWPGRIKPGTRSAEMISLTDMLATFAALTGKSLPPGAGPDSYNVLPALLGQKVPDPKRPMVMLSGGMGALAIREGKWKLIDGQGACGYGHHRRPKPKPGDPPAQLYDLEKDLGETTNLYAQHPEIVQRLKQSLEKIKTQGHRRSESTSNTHARRAALFNEDFDGIRGGGGGNQWQTGLPLKHSANLPGWTKTGRNSVHAVQRTAGNWALQLVGSERGDNVLTQNAGFAANVKGKTYVVSFDAGPSVWAGGQQATKAGHQLSVELLRADNSVLAKSKVSPGAWAGKQVFSHQTFAYEGDGSGNLRFRLSPVDSKGTYFHGAIDNLQVFGSAAEAAAAVATRLKAEKRQLEIARQNAKRTVLESDWLFQADDKPTVARALQEITWARQLAIKPRPLVAPGAHGGGFRQRLARPAVAALWAELDALEKQLNALKAKAGDRQAARELYLAVRRVKRRIVMKNPALDFTQLLLIDQPYPGGGREWRHEAIHRLGHRAVPGGRLLVLDGLHPDAAVRRLFPPKPGSFWRPDLSFDGKRVLFCYKAADEKSFHLYEINLDGSGLRQLTDGDYDDIDPIYLPDGHIMFTTTRGNTYVRCGPYIYSYLLARCDADGGNVYIISRGNEPDWTPALMHDGRVIYSRWEYTDKSQLRVQSLWTTNPDGTNTAVFWGNQSVWPDHLAEPRPIPGSRRVMFSGVGHHDWFTGSIGIVDPDRGFNFPHGLTKVTQDLRWAECSIPPVDPRETADYHASGRYTSYKTPYPISERDFLVSARGKGNKFRLYLMDVYGNRELIYEGAHNIWHAVPIRPRPVPPQQPDCVAWPGTGKDRKTPELGVLYSADVYEGVPDLPRGTVKYLRVFQQDHKTFSTWRKLFRTGGPPISLVQEDGVKRILSVVPVETDGSVHFEVPPGRALHFQLLDEHYRGLQTMRSFSGVMPGEERGCVGCHELHSTLPPPKSGLAFRRPPTTLTPPPWGDESISFERFVQPVLTRYCGKCHQGKGEARKKLDLTLRPGHSVFKEPYLTLVGSAGSWEALFGPGGRNPVGDTGQPGYGFAGAIPVENLGRGRDDPKTYATIRPMRFLSYKSKLIERAMSGRHHDVVVDPLSLRKLIAWVDACCPFLGEEELRAMDDPDFPGIEQLPIRPRVKTAPVIERP